MTKLGSWITKQLEDSDRTTEALAKAMGIDVGTLNEIMNGGIKRPPDARLGAIAKFFGVSVEQVRGLIAGKRLEEGEDIKKGDKQVNAIDRSIVEIVWHKVTAGEQQWIRIIPDGEVDTENEPFVLDAAGAARAIEFFEARDVDIVVDYEHETLKPTTGGTPAAGWIKGLKYISGDGLYALVRWNERATQFLRAQEYKYLSPALMIDMETRHLLRIDSIGLVQKPAIKGGMPIAASRGILLRENQQMAGEPESTGGDPGILIGEIKALLGVEGVEATASLMENLMAIKEAVKALKSDSEGDAGADGGEGGDAGGSGKVATAARSALGLSASANREAVTLAISALKDKSLGAESHATRIQELETRIASQEREAFLKPYIAKGVIDPVKRKEDFAMVCRAFAHSRDDCKMILEQRTAALPPGGKLVGPDDSTSAGGGRDEVIVKASREYDGEPMLHKLTTRDEYVDLQLREAGKSALSDDEQKTLAA